MKTVLVACALLFAATALSRDWAGDRLVHLGPMGAEACIPGVRVGRPPGAVECKPEPLATIRGDVELLRWSVLVPAVARAFYLGLAAAIAGIVALVVVARHGKATEARTDTNAVS